jgi:hypothetical protein
MSKLSQTKKIIALLKDNPLKRYTARELAEEIIALYPEDYATKKQNPRFEDERAFVSQVVAEIGAQKAQLIKASKHIFWQDKPRPRVYWFDPKHKMGEESSYQEDEVLSESTQKALKEHDLYPLLMEYLYWEHGLFCLRIDEKRSKNQRGKGGNTWLHPDVVALEALDKSWNELVRTCVKSGNGKSVRLWSFEVKIMLESGNVRKSFFQAVSNSSWANEGYLVATSISNAKVEQELRMLSALHGIGVILLNIENPSESEILLPARSRAEVDWESVNRIVEENRDFEDYIELVSGYYLTGRIRDGDWGK